MDKWIEINVDAVKNNLREVRSLLDDKTNLIAVIKANAYGHGAEGMAQILVQNGVTFLAVSFLEEALQLRRSGINASILIFSPVVSYEDARDSILNKLTLTVSSDADRMLLERVGADLNTQVTVHLKIDTGLGRFGVTIEDAVDVFREIKDSKILDLEGIYSHCADPSSAKYTEHQFNKFMALVNRLEQEEMSVPIKHFANSSVFLRSPHMSLNAVRIGTLLSGQHPAGKFPRHLQLEDPFKFKSRIISIKSMKKASYLGYYRTFRLQNDAQIAVIPVGFNDGLAVEVANRPTGILDLIKKIIKLILNYLNYGRLSINVKINGNKYPVRGKVFMQMALIEIPLRVKINIGDVVEVPVRKTLVSQGIDRIYIQESDWQNQNNGSQFEEYRVDKTGN